MNKMNNDLKDNRNTCIMLVIPIAIIAKLIEHLFLPDKYFFDSSRMLIMMQDREFKQAWEGSYRVTVDIFNRINIFKFTTLLQWSIFVGIIFNIIVIFMLKKTRGMSLWQCVFTLMCIGLGNIYIFNLGKDIIQFTLFFMCFVAISIKCIPNMMKVIICVGVFYWESTFFRNYYIIIAFFIFAIYMIFKVARVRKVKLNLVKILMTIIVLYGFVYLFLNVARVAMPNEYQEILECKESSTQIGASSVIDDKIDFGENINLYMANYIINSLRMVFPIELINEGGFYLPFLLFQIILLYYIVVNIKNMHAIRENNVIALSCFLAYFMGSVLFEPDFGSFARHEAATFPVILLFAIDNDAILGVNVQNRS